ncbi:MAG: hypothetical protein AAF567_03935 [Actinomycetota bacterium]
MTVVRMTRLALGWLTLISLQLGIWALFAPRSFYDDFPGLGRTWVSVDGPFNEHLVRDVGALNLALVLLFVAAAWRGSRDLVVVAGGAAILWGLPHFLYHLVNTEGLAAGDAAASLTGLAVYVAAGAVLVWTGRTIESTTALQEID